MAWRTCSDLPTPQSVFIVNPQVREFHADKVIEGNCFVPPQFQRAGPTLLRFYMTSPISSVKTYTQVAQAAPVTKKSTEAAPETSATAKPKAAAKPVVQISDAGRAALLQEATESAATTAAEAQGGDRQAQRLVAKQAAAKTH